MYAQALCFVLLASISLPMTAYGLAVQPRIDSLPSSSILARQNSSSPNLNGPVRQGTPINPAQTPNDVEPSLQNDEIWSWRKGRYYAGFYKPFGPTDATMPQATVVQAVNAGTAHLRQQEIGRSASDTVPGGMWSFGHGGVRLIVSRTVRKEVTFEEVDFALHAIRAFAQLQPHVPKAQVYVAFDTSIVAYASLGADGQQRVMSSTK